MSRSTRTPATPTESAIGAVTLVGAVVTVTGAVKHSDRIQFVGRTISLVAGVALWTIKGLALLKVERA